MYIYTHILYNKLLAVWMQTHQMVSYRIHDYSLSLFFSHSPRESSYNRESASV